MNKKGQVTVFIIIGIIVLALVVIGLYLYSQARAEESEDEVEQAYTGPLEMQSIDSYIKDCLKDTLTPAIYLVGAQGGHVVPPNRTIIFNGAKIGYGTYDGENQIPTRQYIETQLGQFIDSSLLLCINNFESFPGKDIAFENPNSTITIGNDRVDADVKFLVTLKEGGDTYTLDSFSMSSNIPLGNSLNIAKDIVNGWIDDPEYIDVDALSAYEQKIDILSFDENNYIVSVRDKTTPREDFSFMFVNNKQLTLPPVMTIDDSFTLDRGGAFSRTIFTDKPATFEDDTAMFDIDENSGKIEFTPTVPGVYNVTITAIGDTGASSKKMIEFVIR